MIQSPINVFPQNQAITVTGLPSDYSNYISTKFTFKGDYLSGVWTRIFDYDTGALIREDINEDQHRYPLAYNDDEYFRQINWAGLVNGRRYTFQMMLVQRTADGSTPICDMPVIGSEVLQAVNNDNVVYIEKGISAIYPWGKSGDVYSIKEVNSYQFNPMKITIGNTTRTILSYEDNYEIDGVVYGKLTLDGNVTASEGDYYRIYSNAIISPQYFFKCDSVPVITFDSCAPYRDCISYEARYTQANGVGIKYYTLQLWWANNKYFSTTTAGDKVRLIEETKRIYSQKLRYDFTSPYYHEYDVVEGENPRYDYYKVEVIGVTQDDMKFTHTTYLTPNENDGLEDNENAGLDPEGRGIVPFDCRSATSGGRLLHGYTVTEDYNKGVATQHLVGYTPVYNGEYELFRKDLRTGEDELVGWTGLDFSGGEGHLDGDDKIASLKGHYQYATLFFTDSGRVVIPAVTIPNYEYSYPVGEIEMNENAYYITSLDEVTTDYSDNPSPPIHREDVAPKKVYWIGDTWKFVGDIANTTVTNNLDTMAQVGYGRYISTTSTEVNYMSGTLSAMIGYVDCVNRKYIDDIALVQAWRKFITQKKPFLLKSQKGDVWVVSIVDNPTTEYDETVRSIPTTFSFSWAECDSVNNIILKEID